MAIVVNNKKHHAHVINVKDIECVIYHFLKEFFFKFELINNQLSI